MKDASWYAVRNVTDKSAEVAIYDEIGLFGVTAKEFTNSIKGLSNRRLTVRIHSPGGEIFEGNAVYNALRRHKGGVDVAIDGLAASMASVIAMAGEKRSMAENAMFMIHNPWAGTFGQASELRSTANLLDTLKENIITSYAGRTGLDRDELSDMMDEETWLTAEEAKAKGFVTDITESLDMRNSFERFDISRFPKRPTNFMAKKSAPEIEAAAEVEEVVAPVAVVEVAAVAEISEAEKALLALPAYRDENINLVKENDGLRAQIAAKDAEIAAKDAKIAEKEAHLSHLEKLALVAPASQVVEVPASNEAQRSIIDIYESLDGEEASSFYRKHQAELSKFIVRKKA